MGRYYDHMSAFVDYIRTQKAGTGRTRTSSTPRSRDWVGGDQTTSGRITGTWGYYLTAHRMATMAALLGHTPTPRSTESSPPTSGPRSTTPSTTRAGPLHR